MPDKTAASPMLPRPPLMPRDAGVPLHETTDIDIPVEAVAGAAGAGFGALTARDRLRGLLQGLGAGAGAAFGGRAMLPADNEPDWGTILGLLGGGGAGYAAGSGLASLAGHPAVEEKRRGVLDPDEKAGEAHPDLLKLLQAKAHSDRRQYLNKHGILRSLITNDPTSFVIDSRDPGGIVGLTHVPTKFRIHMPGHMLPSGVNLIEQLPEPVDVVEKAANRLLAAVNGFRSAAAPVASAAKSVGGATLGATKAVGGRAVESVKAWPGLNRGGTLEGVNPFNRAAQPLYMPRTATTYTLPNLIRQVPFTGGRADNLATGVKVMAHKAHGYTPVGVIGRTANRAMNRVAGSSGLGNTAVNSFRIARNALKTSPLKIPLHFIHPRLGRMANPISGVGVGGYAAHKGMSQAPNQIVDDLRSAGVDDADTLDRQWWNTYKAQPKAVLGLAAPGWAGGDTTGMGAAPYRAATRLGGSDTAGQTVQTAAGDAARQLADDPTQALRTDDPVGAVRRPSVLMQPPQAAAGQYIANQAAKRLAPTAAPLAQDEFSRAAIANPTDLATSPLVHSYFGTVDPALAGDPRVATRLVEGVFGQGLADPAQAEAVLQRLPPEAPQVLRTYLQTRTGGSQ